MAASKSASTRSKTSRKHRQPKVHSRPSAVDFWAAARRLDALNVIALNRRVPLLHLSTEREQLERQQTERCIIEHSQTEVPQQRWIPRSTKTNRQRPEKEDCGDEGMYILHHINDKTYIITIGSLAPCYRQSSINNCQGIQNIYQLNINPTPERIVSSEDCSDGTDNSNDNQTEVIDQVSDEGEDVDDLEIDMHGWDTQLHPGPSSQGQNPRYFTRGQRSRTTSSRLHQLPTTPPPPTHKRSRGIQRSRRLADNASPSASIIPLRQPDTIPKTLYSDNVKEAPLFESYDKRTDPEYDAVRDLEHRIHWGCDIALLSVEDAYVRRERTELRARRRYM
jgi:hypothetical protein